MMGTFKHIVAVGVIAIGINLGSGGCTPRIEVAPSDKPITINLNIKIDHEIRVKVEKELDEVLSENGELF